MEHMKARCVVSSQTPERSLIEIMRLRRRSRDVNDHDAPPAQAIMASSLQRVGDVSVETKLIIFASEEVRARVHTCLCVCLCEMASTYWYLVVTIATHEFVGTLADFLRFYFALLCIRSPRTQLCNKPLTRHIQRYLSSREQFII